MKITLPFTFTCVTLLALMAFKNAPLQSPRLLQLTDTTKWPARFGFGHKPTAQEIAAWDIDVRPDGKGLPKGQGDTEKGRALYALKCVACHGANTIEASSTKLLGPVLIGDTTAKSKPKTIGNYWPYATTLFDYVRRAMPYNQPGLLTNDEVYSITAYLLSANKIIKTGTVLNAQNLPKIIMPAKKLFIMDDRKGGPEVK
jgi:mono/diheme cytochrome c family protein